MRFWLLLLCLPTAFSLQAQKQIVVTVDDLPTVSRFYRTPADRMAMTRRLLHHFREYQVPAIGFVVSQWLYRDGAPDPDQVAILKQWLEAGYELGNHTFAHKDLNRISIREYLDDVSGGEKITRDLVSRQGKPFRYFRHPFLRKGDTPGKKDSLERFLVQHQYREAPVTVDNSDYLFSLAFDKALLKGDTATAGEVGRQYLDYMTAVVGYYEAQTDSLFGRQIPQTLLIHANSINAHYFGELLRRLKNRGYSFISLEDALKDEAYRSEDRYVGRGGISWLHRWALTRGKKGAFFKGEPEVPALVNQLAEGQ
ncbi:polysaccharide deacetylase family protein [Larkinella soli]|uniref:polysaccharide deacetylase family protein n=1 Tax=Larkinella soli TaxID=1770527 RepID=UPI000FFC5869|nr:polysaccharide deacetylase family protein [Larkinella soli]